MRFLLLLLTAFSLLVSGCATHLQSLSAVRESLYSGDVPKAVAEFDKKKAKNDDLLWLLEKAHLSHLDGRWAESNQYFQSAEIKADELYTKSVSKGALSLLSSDKVLPYSSPLFEMSLIPYYRMINYRQLGQIDEALVEARKSCFNLSRLSQKTADGNLRSLAFLNYSAGLLYASARQWEDAHISFQHARGQYAKTGNPPASLEADAYFAALKSGRAAEMKDALAQNPNLPAQARAEAGRNVILFIESGFSPYRDQATITLPLIEPVEGENAERLATRYVDRYGNSYLTYSQPAGKLKQVLQFAFPVLRDPPSAVAAFEAGASSGSLQRSQPLLDLVPAVHEQFDRESPGIFLKTVARAVTKELARHQAAKSGGSALGWAVNILNIGTEQADTRSWLMLPARFEMVKLTIPTGSPQSVRVRSLGPDGQVLEEKVLPVTVAPGEVKWLSVRFYK